MIRSFIAFDLPPNVIESLANIQEALRYKGDGIRWVKPESIHLTLNFLGYIGEEIVPKIHAAMVEATADTTPLNFSLGKIGAFPTVTNPRVIWVGLDGEIEPLSLMKKKLDQLLVPLGFFPEKRPFKPHLTLARCKNVKNPERLKKALASLELAYQSSFMLLNFILFKSELLPDGAKYTPLVQIKLCRDSSSNTL